MNEVVILLMKGFFVGVFASLPTGPVGFLCIKRTISDGFLAGFLSGAGATVAHLFYGIIVITGLQTVTHIFNIYHSELVILSIFVLFLIGYIIFKYHKKSLELHDTTDTKTLLRCFTTSTFITLINPIQLISFSGIFIFLDVIHNSQNLNGVLILGIALGSLSCWLLLSFYIKTVRHKFSNNDMIMLHKICGIIIMSSSFIFLFKYFL